jgi:hypothetical protein
MDKKNKASEHKKGLHKMIRTQEVVVAGDKIQGRVWEFDAIDSTNALKYFLEGEIELANKMSDSLLQLYEWRMT